MCVNGVDVSHVHMLSCVHVHMFWTFLDFGISEFQISAFGFRIFGFRISDFGSDGSIDRLRRVGESRAIIDWWRPCN